MESKCSWTEFFALFWIWIDGCCLYGKKTKIFFAKKIVKLFEDLLCLWRIKQIVTIFLWTFNFFSVQNWPFFKQFTCWRHNFKTLKKWQWVTLNTWKKCAWIYALRPPENWPREWEFCVCILSLLSKPPYNFLQWKNGDNCLDFSFIF